MTAYERNELLKFLDGKGYPVKRPVSDEDILLMAKALGWDLVNKEGGD